MAEALLTHRYFIAVPAAKIYAHLAEPTSYIGLSPLVVAVDDMRYSQDEASRRVCHYVSVERFRFLGFIPYDNHIHVKTTFTQPDVQMISDVDSQPNIKVRFVFDFTEAEGGTWVQESITLSMPAPLKGFVVGQAKSVQHSRTEILKQRMESA